MTLFNKIDGYPSQNTKNIQPKTEVPHMERGLHQPANGLPQPTTASALSQAPEATKLIEIRLPTPAFYMILTEVVGNRYYSATEKDQYKYDGYIARESGGRLTLSGFNQFCFLKVIQRLTELYSANQKKNEEINKRHKNALLGETAHIEMSDLIDLYPHLNYKYVWRRVANSNQNAQHRSPIPRWFVDPEGKRKLVRIPALAAFPVSQLPSLWNEYVHKTLSTDPSVSIDECVECQKFLWEKTIVRWLRIYEKRSHQPGKKP